MPLSLTCIQLPGTNPKPPEMTGAPHATDNPAARKSWTSSLAASPQVCSEWSPPRRRSLYHPAPRNTGLPVTVHAIPRRAECFAQSIDTLRNLWLLTRSYMRAKDGFMETCMHAESIIYFDIVLMIFSNFAVKSEHETYFIWLPLS